MNLKISTLIGILILTGIGIWFAIQNEKTKSEQPKMKILPNISIIESEEENPEITLISVYDNY